MYKIDIYLGDILKENFVKGKNKLQEKRDNMLVNRYSVNQKSINSLLIDIKAKEIAIPEIQRPFVWDATKVRDLIDSLYQGDIQQAI